jgi:Ca2+-binding RTX toxin-like protein
VDYTARSYGLTITLDSLANDGESGEGDNLETEEVLGGSGNDLMTGNNASNDFSGGPGNDTLYGLGGGDLLIAGLGNDALYGGDGDDSLYAKNNDVDTVNGGNGLDFAETDPIDV